MSTTATARPTAKPRVPSPAQFRPITIADTNGGIGSGTTATVAVVSGPTTSPVPISDFEVEPRTFAQRPTPHQANVARSVAKQVAWRFHSTGRHASGSATWYCKSGTSACAAGYPGGMYAAAGPELRVGAWRGRVVRVCGSGACILVKLVDWCACGGSHVIDLYGDAFGRLTPLASGAVKVTVSW
jgi:rare lipoprotein A (RlpA)-like double-psi beta-barrel protein